jgi:integrase/recombinase XerD
MAGKQAKTLSSNDFHDLLTYTSTTRHPLRNRLIVLLSLKAGLRASEITGLTWDMVLNANGEIGSALELHDKVAKNGSGRTIPLHPELLDTFKAWQSLSADSGPIIRSERGGTMRPLSVVLWFRKAFASLGLRGCSSHSGRRTFITRAARLAHKTGGCLRYVQLLAGHQSIQTTQRYIDGDSEAQHKLVALI